MKAKVLDYNIQEGTGLLLTDEGERYTFTNKEWRSSDIHPSKDILVDFVVEDNGIATGLYVEHRSSKRNSQTLNNISNHIDSREKSKIIAGVLGIFLGGLGLHKFYLGCQTEGIIMLVVWFTGWFFAGIPSFIIITIALIEGVIYITKSDNEFEEIYVNNQKCWF